MSTVIGPETEALATSAVSSAPRQGRSLASFERMLDATKALMLERGSEEFTLQDVSDRGAVSIGSIYLRFESKDRLLHAVIARELEAVIAAEAAMLDVLSQQSTDLRSFIDAYIERYSTMLGEHARVLHAIMQRAAIDPAVSGPGKETARRSTEMSVAALMRFEGEIAGTDKRTRAEAVFHVIFAAIAREYGLGGTPEAGDPKVWNVVRAQLAKMVYAYLRFED